MQQSVFFQKKIHTPGKNGTPLCGKSCSNQSLNDTRCRGTCVNGKFCQHCNKSFDGKPRENSQFRVLTKPPHLAEASYFLCSYIQNVWPHKP